MAVVWGGPHAALAGSLRQRFSEGRFVKEEFMRILATVLALLMVSACASEAQRKARFYQAMDPFVGGTADDLVLAKGPPTNSFTLTTGGRVFEYTQRQTVTSGGGSYPVGGPVVVADGHGGGWVLPPVYHRVPVTTAEYYCKILVRISPANLVESWSAEGNGCY
jgi:hypothetical protein